MAAEARRRTALASWLDAWVTASAKLPAISTAKIFLTGVLLAERTPGGFTLFRALDVERQRAERQVVGAQAAGAGLGQRLRGGRGGVLLRAPRTVRDLEDFHGRDSRRALQEAAVGFGRHAEQGAQALAVQQYRIPKHVRGAESRLRHDVVLADLEIPALDCWKSHEVLCGWKGAKQRTAKSVRASKPDIL